MGRGRTHTGSCTRLVCLRALGRFHSIYSGSELRSIKWKVSATVMCLHKERTLCLSRGSYRMELVVENIQKQTPFFHFSPQLPNTTGVQPPCGLVVGSTAEQVAVVLSLSHYTFSPALWVKGFCCLTDTDSGKSSDHCKDSNLQPCLACLRVFNHCFSPCITLLWHNDALQSSILTSAKQK